MLRGGTIPVAPTPSAADYCRAARRIRGRCGRRSGRLHQELRALATRYDAVRAAAPATAPLAARPCEAFAAEVADRMDGPILRHAQRRALFAIAGKSGIGRFEANLIIAAVQHERAAVMPVAKPPHTAPPSWRCGPVVVAAVLQTLIAWGAWIVFCA